MAYAYFCIRKTINMTFMKYKTLFHSIAIAAALTLAMDGSAAAQDATGRYTPTPENLKARAEFQDNKFGIFLHWGIYSMPGQGEWYMNNAGIGRSEYEKLALGFYPSRFNAAEWVAAIKASGARYICITSRHHDGFSMFDTRYSDFDIVDATPFGRDVIKELADECHRQGIKLHFYYSHLDWRRDDYPQGHTGRNSGRPEGHGDWPSYFQFMNNQLTELLTNYGPIGAIWFDGFWDQPTDFDWQTDEQYALIHRLQPSCLIGNNHHRNINPGEDIQIFERDQPGENTAGYSGQDISSLPLETCQTMNGMWGYKIQDQNYKSAKELIHYLVRTAGKNANLLLNIGPQPNGELPATAVQRLQEMGEWMDNYGETIYGTRGGDIAPRPWGATTRKGNRLFVHILDIADDGLYLPLEATVKDAKVFIDGTPVKFRQEKGGGVLLKLPKVPDEIDYVIELTLKQ